MIKIIGAKGNIEDVDIFLKQISDFSEKNKIIIQAFNADLIFGKNHIISSYNHAVRSFKRKNNITNSLAMEVLLYSSGERQIKLAIPKMGINKGTANVAFVFIGEKLSNKKINEFLKMIYFKFDDKVIEGDINTLKKFGFSDTEIKTVVKDKYEDLILEKVAMVDIIK